MYVWLGACVLRGSQGERMEPRRGSQEVRMARRQSPSLKEFVLARLRLSGKLYKRVSVLSNLLYLSAFRNIMQFSNTSTIYKHLICSFSL